MNGDIKYEQSPVIRAVELMLQAQFESRHVLLVEGPSDYQLFNRFIAEEGWELEYLEGKEGLLECATVLESMGMSHFRVLTDRDPLDPVAIPGAHYTTEADLEADLLEIDRILEAALMSRAADRPQKRLSELGCGSWRELVYGLVSPWTSLRIALAKAGHSVPMRDFPVHALANRLTGTTSVAATATEISRRTRGSIASARAEMLISSISPDDLRGIHNGHHLASAIAWASSMLLGGPKVESERIEELIRATVTMSELLTLACVRELDSWAHSRSACLWTAGSCLTCEEQSDARAAQHDVDNPTNTDVILGTFELDNV